MILSGLITGSPRLILSTFSMPSVTWPQTVYWPLRKSVIETDEKLAVARIGVARTRHRSGAALMRCAVEFGLELLARSTHPGALRAARLCHEAVDDAMKYDPIIETLSHQLLDARHVAGRKVGP